MIVPTIAAFVFALAISLMLAPLVRRGALHFGLTDKPDGNRKQQREPIALGGGIAIYLSLMMVVGVIFVSAEYWSTDMQRNWRDGIGFGVACTIIVIVGLFDDAIGLRGRHKVLGQMVAASCLMATGLVVRHIGLFGVSIDLGLLSMPFTMFWLLGAINAINLLDGIDGLATVLGIILTATIGALAALNEFYGVALLAFAITGSLMGFLRYNWPPARMYLGDAGSMLIGLLVGAMAIRANLKGPGTLLLAAPLAIWAIPILDSGAAIVRRRLTGRSLFATDRGHLHHRLLEALGSNTKVLMVISACCVATSTGALISVMFKNEVYCVVSCVAVIAMLLATGVFGRAEFRLLLGRLRGAGLSLTHPTHIGGKARETQIHLQGNQKWAVLWETLTESADKLQLCSVHLDINAPALHESYVATWTWPGAGLGLENSWRLEVPLSVADIQIGSLLVQGRRNGNSCLGEVVQLLDLLEPFEIRLAALAKSNSARRPKLVEMVE
ncbi:MAG: MraY family glycosyltransferase [Pirellulaceae bacterium]